MNILTEDKLFKVVESCKTLEQLKVAEQYVKLAEQYKGHSDVHKTTFPFIRDIIKFKKISYFN